METTEAVKAIHEVLNKFSELEQNIIIKAVREQLADLRELKAKQIQAQADAISDSLKSL